MFDGLLQLNVLHIKDIVGLDGIVNVFLAILRFLSKWSFVLGGLSILPCHFVVAAFFYFMVMSAARFLLLHECFLCLIFTFPSCAVGLLFFWLRCCLQTWPVIYVYGRLLFFILVYGSGCFVNVPLGSVGYLNATVEAKRGSYLARHNRKGRLVP